MAGYLAEAHRAVFPAASVAAVDAILDVFVEVSWSRLRRRQQTCPETKTPSVYTEDIHTSTHSVMVLIFYLLQLIDISG